ncbi:MAG: alpha/beta fold hydrolase, partial [Bryobacteraceae bacterium]
MGCLGLIALVAVALAAIVVLAGVLYQRAGSARDAQRCPPPGTLFDIGGCRLHLDRRGEGSPTVVFEAGIAATSLSWRRVQGEIAQVTTTASYDRAWLGWSDAGAQPRSVEQLVEELHNLLDCAGVARPVILVAHSYGGFVALAYQARYTADVAGIVLVDPLTCEEWMAPSESQSKRLRRGILLSRRGGRLARIGLVRFATGLLAGGGRAAPKLIA